MIEDDCYFLGVEIRLSTRCKMFHFKITWPFLQKSHECALKLTDLWITSLLFDLHYKFFNGSFALSPGEICILLLLIKPSYFLACFVTVFGKVGATPAASINETGLCSSAAVVP